MELADILKSDPHTLPYFITEVQTGDKVPVRFEPLALDDIVELQGAVWSRAVFASVWQHYAGDVRTYKLVCKEGGDRRIQGIVRIGSIAPHGRLLKTSLLETASFNRKEHPARVFRGVGRVLVARLAVESILQGGQGRVVVRPREGTASFYLALSFIKNNSYVLNATNAQMLLNSVITAVSKGD